ncbi:MAG: alpha/beta hydrolase [Cyanobacteria bacterium J06626_23]
MYRRQFLSLLPAIPLLGRLSQSQTVSISSAHVSINGCQHFYQMAGMGRPIVFVHGMGMSSQFFQKQLNDSAMPYQRIAYDLRGHGQTEVTADGYTVPQFARDLHGLLQTLNLQNAVLVGWSTGTLVVLDYLSQFGNDRIAGVSLAVEPASELRQDNWPYGSVDDRALGDYRSVLARMTVPTLLAYGAQDVMMPLQASEYFESHLPHAKLVVLKQRGHRPYWQEPTRFNQELSKFIATV